MENGALQNHHGSQLRNDIPKILLITHAGDRNTTHYLTRELACCLGSKFSQSFVTEVLMFTDDPLFLRPDFVNRMAVLTSSVANDLVAEFNSNEHYAGLLFQYDKYLARNHEFFSFFKRIKKSRFLILNDLAACNQDNEFAEMLSVCDTIITKTTKDLRKLTEEYGLPDIRVFCIPDGIRRAISDNRSAAKKKKGFANRTVLSITDVDLSDSLFSNILTAFREVIKTSNETLLLFITTTKSKADELHDFLQEYSIGGNFKIILAHEEELNEYLGLSDLYLAPGKDAYLELSAGCGCAIISSSSPLACDLLSEDCGMVIDFSDTCQIHESINRLLFDISYRKTVRRNILVRARTQNWENSALSYAALFENHLGPHTSLTFDIPPVNYTAFPKLVTPFGMLRTSGPDSGYSLVDNLHVLLFLQYARESEYTTTFHACFSYIKHCLQDKGYFLNYASSSGSFTEENNSINLADVNGKAIWVLGSLSASDALPHPLRSETNAILQKALGRVNTFYSPYAIACTIKGLHSYNRKAASASLSDHIKLLADKLVQSYQKESRHDWNWFESFLSHPSSVIPSALLCAYEESGNIGHKEVAVATFDFFISNCFDGKRISINLSKNWMRKKKPQAGYRVDSSDVMHLILSLQHFYETLKESRYLHLMKQAFDWFLGNNEELQVIYHSSSGECYETHQAPGVLHAKTLSAFYISHSIVNQYAKEHLFSLKHKYRAAS